jgi:hypothetical protein
MEMNRRDMLTAAGAFALLAHAADPYGFAQAVSNSPQHANAVDVSDYWSRFYDDTQGRGAEALADKKRKTVYVHAPDSGQALVYADTLPMTVLPAIKGDAVARLAVSQYRPGKGDISTDVSHLRIDASQTFDFMNIVAPVSWAAIASITPDNQMSKLPTIDQFGFNEQPSTDAANIKQITLPKGVGNMSVNVTRPANPEFTKIVKGSSMVITAALSMLVLPAVSVPAIRVFSVLFGKWQSHATVIMNGNLQPVIATSSPAQDFPMPQEPMPLKNGYYVMFPKAHQDELDSDFKNLVVKNGFIVHKDDNDGDLAAQAGRAVPGVSYATLRVYVDPATNPSCAGKPTGAA